MPPEAVRLEAEADRLVAVQIEASRVTPPLAALSGHLQEVTCVAVTRDRDPLIVSGSEDGTVRIWERIPGSDAGRSTPGWTIAPIVRAVACTSAEGQAQPAADGDGDGPRSACSTWTTSRRASASSRAGTPAAINAVAFNADGTRCVTGGEDRSICLWDTADGTLLGKVAGAHGAGITSLAFTAKNQVVSAGRDKRLVVWNLVEGGEGGQTLEKGRRVRPPQRRRGATGR